MIVINNTALASLHMLLSTYVKVSAPFLKAHLIEEHNLLTNNHAIVGKAWYGKQNTH